MNGREKAKKEREKSIEKEQKVISHDNNIKIQISSFFRASRRLLFALARYHR